MGLASRGLRDMDTGEEQITDAMVLQAVRKQARGVHLRSIALSIALTALALALPAV